MGWGQGFGGLNLVLLAWRGLRTTVFLHFSCLVVFFLALFCLEKLGCDDRSMLSRCPVGDLILHPFLGFKPDKLHPVVLRQFAILEICVMQQCRVRKPVCILLGYIFDSTPPVPMFCFGPLVASLHWIVGKFHLLPPCGWTLLARQVGVGKLFLLQNADPSFWFLAIG